MIPRCSDIMKRNNPKDDYCTQCLHGVVFVLFCAEKVEI